MHWVNEDQYSDGDITSEMEQQGYKPSVLASYYKETYRLHWLCLTSGFNGKLQALR